MNKLFTPFVAAVVAALCLTAASAPSSGIRVTVTLGPTCPVERAGMVCERPYAAAIAISTESGARLKTVRTSSNGHMCLMLQPGTYLLTPLARNPASPYPHARPVTVSVKPRSFTDVKIQYDTGIR